MKKIFKSMIVGLAIAVGVTTPSQVKAQNACTISGPECVATLNISLINSNPNFSLPTLLFEMPELNYKAGGTFELEIPVFNLGSADLDIDTTLLSGPSHITVTGTQTPVPAGQTINVPVTLTVGQNNLDSATIALRVAGTVAAPAAGPITVN